MGGLAERLAAIDERIADAARAAHRDPSELTRIVVTKFHPASLVKELYGLGVRDVGENRQQEFSRKAVEVGALDGLHWHFIGQASVVHSLDRARLADALDAAAEPGDLVLDVLLQVNLTDDPGRGGVAPGDLEALASHAAALPSLRVRGVMAVAPLDEPPAPAF